MPMTDDDFICGMLVREILRAKRGMEMKEAADAIFRVRLMITGPREKAEAEKEQADTMQSQRVG